MTSWKRAWREGLVTGSLASVLSAVWLARCGHRRGAPAAPVNAVSHWIFGDRALREDEPSGRFTLIGYGIHHAASIFWGVLHAKVVGGDARARHPLPAAGSSVVAAGIACWVDYRCTPRRFTPGFEHRLSRAEMAVVYGSFALGLYLGVRLLARQSRPQAPEDAT